MVIEEIATIKIVITIPSLNILDTFLSGALLSGMLASYYLWI